MKKTIFILTLIFGFALLPSLVKAADQTDVDAKIKQIASYLDKPGGPGEDGKTRDGRWVHTLMHGSYPVDKIPEGYVRRFYSGLFEIKDKK